MNYRILTTALLFLGTATPVLAVGDHQSRERGVATRFTEFADVIEARPVYREVSLREPRQECWTEQERYVSGYREQSYSQRRDNNHYRESRRSSTGDVIVGSVIGGVIGNQLGRKGSNSTRNGATIAGAIIGGAVVNEAGSGYSRHRRDNQRYEPRHQTHNVREPIYATRPVERCKRVQNTRYDRVVQYYDVTYRYQGQTLTTRMTRDPGRRLELQVSVKPVRH